MTGYSGWEWQFLYRSFWKKAMKVPDLIKILKFTVFDSPRDSDLKILMRSKNSDFSLAGSIIWLKINWHKIGHDNLWCGLVLKLNVPRKESCLTVLKILNSWFLDFPNPLPPEITRLTNNLSDDFPDMSRVPISSTFLKGI